MLWSKLCFVFVGMVGFGSAFTPLAVRRSPLNTVLGMSDVDTWIAAPADVATEQLTLIDANLKRLMDDKGLRHFMGKNNGEEDLTLEEIDKDDRYFIMASGGERGRYGLNVVYANTAALDVMCYNFAEITDTPATHMAKRGIDRKKYKAYLDTLEMRGKEGMDKEYFGFRSSNMGIRFYIREGMMWNLYDDDGNYCGQALFFDRKKACFTDPDLHSLYGI
uniref:MEKHLA domain-containing protein n=1 Tax=Cyclophora tenuis TaxID=216820 RepID=A0A7S1GGR4_CYCTE